jgi:hypothetical protein
MGVWRLGLCVLTTVQVALPALGTGATKALDQTPQPTASIVHGIFALLEARERTWACQPPGPYGITARYPNRNALL